MALAELLGLCPSGGRLGRIQRAKTRRRSTTIVADTQDQSYDFAFGLLTVRKYSMSICGDKKAQLLWCDPIASYLEGAAVVAATDPDALPDASEAGVNAAVTVAGIGIAVALHTGVPTAWLGVTHPGYPTIGSL